MAELADDEAPMKFMFGSIAVVAICVCIIQCFEARVEYETGRMAIENGYEQVGDEHGNLVWRKVDE